MLNNLKVSVRLGLSFGLVLLLMGIIIIVGVRGLAEVNDITERMATQDWTKSVLANDIIDLANDNARASFELLLITDPRELENIRNRIDESVAAIDGKVEQLDEMLYKQEGKERLAAMREARRPYVESFRRVDKLLQDGATEQAVDLMTNETLSALNTFMASIASLVEFQGQLMEDAGEQAASTYSGARTVMLIVGLIAVLIGLAAAFLVTRGLTRQLGGEPQYAADVAIKIAEGDLTSTVKVRDGDTTSMLACMKTMTDKLSEIVSEVNSAGDALASASEEVSATAQSLSQGASEQAASVEETTSSVEQMSASIEQNNENSRVTNDISSKAAREATEGGEAVDKTVEAMKEIAEKISIIDEIAYQTNLLALNAAIEAARAGEHGKGFAVVAAEVRKLAERSQEAAKEIGETANGSVELAQRAGELLETMVPSIQKTSELVQEISAASSEQASGAAQINDAMEQLNSITQQSASSSEELASTSEEMSGQAQQLQQLMAFFKIKGGTIKQRERAPLPASKSHERQGAASTSRKSESSRRTPAMAATADEDDAEFVRF